MDTQEKVNGVQNYNLQEIAKAMVIYQFAVTQVETKLKILSDEFKHLHDNNPIEHIKSRVKKPKSIVEKLQRRGLDVTVENAKEQIYDIAGVRIICSFTSDIYKLAQLIDSQSDLRVIDVKDYIQHPKKNGYRSLHMIIETPVFLSDRIENVKVEIQIRTIAMDFWASLEHKIYYKYRNEAPEGITSQLKECADMITLLDKEMLDIKTEIEKWDEQQ